MTNPLSIIYIGQALVPVPTARHLLAALPLNPNFLYTIYINLKNTSLWTPTCGTEFTLLTHVSSTASRLAGVMSPASLLLMAITCSCLQHGVHFTHPCLQHSFRACWELRPQPRYCLWQSLAHAFSMEFTSLTHACSTASGLAGNCAPSPVIVYGNHSLMPSAWSSLHSPMPAAQLQGLLGAVPPAPLSSMAITPLYLTNQLSLPFMSIHFPLHIPQPFTLYFFLHLSNLSIISSYR